MPKMELKKAEKMWITQRQLKKNKKKKKNIEK